jgi:hypothetical protein
MLNVSSGLLDLEAYLPRLHRNVHMFVMPGLVPGIYVFLAVREAKTWMAGTYSAKTRFALLPGHDDFNETDHALG